jgi:hypothetical protein
VGEVPTDPNCAVIRLSIIGMVLPEFRNSVPDSGRITNRVPVSFPEIVVLLAGHELRLQELMGHDRESRQLWNFHHCEIMGFGFRLRSEFIKKWYQIGREGELEDNSLIQRAVEIERIISGILGKDLLPPYPIYLLLLLQQLESNTALDTSAASYGRLYGAVMTAYLSKSSMGGDLETKINYLSELA